MDANVALALMTKAKAVFEREDTFLSFPVAGQVGYRPEELGFVTNGVSTNEDLLRLSEFCRLVNLVPDGPVWPPSEERYLWDIYEDVMKSDVQFPESVRTPEEEAAYTQAFQTLFDVEENGLRSDSQMLRSYRQYRDAWFAAQEEYRANRPQADVLAVAANWTEVEEPRRKAEIEWIESEWRVKGFRDEVEEAMRVESALGGKSPIRTWQAWDALFDRGVDVQTDTLDRRFVLTGIAPSNVLQSPEWRTFPLTAADVSQLVSQAPAELRDRLSGTSDLDIESVSFEFTSVAVSRTWFAPDLLKARFWRFKDPARVISDGLTPPSGPLPAYVAALVFARSLTVRLRPDTASSGAARDRTVDPRRLSLGVLGMARLAGPPLVAAAGGVTVRQTPTEMPPARRTVMKAALRRTAVKDFARLQIPPVVPTSEPAGPAALTRDHRRATGARVRDHRSAASHQPVVPQVAVFVPPSEPTAAEPTTPDGTAVESSSNDIYILAFICKRVPRCPDPDSYLPW